MMMMMLAFYQIEVDFYSAN